MLVKCCILRGRFYDKKTDPTCPLNDMDIYVRQLMSMIILTGSWPATTLNAYA